MANIILKLIDESKYLYGKYYITTMQLILWDFLWLVLIIDLYKYKGWINKLFEV